MPQGISSAELNKRIKEIKQDWKELKQIAAHIPYQPELSLSETILIRESIIKKYAIDSEYCKEIKKLHSILVDKNSVSSIDPINERDNNIASLQDPKSVNPFPENRVEYLKAEQVVHYFVDPGGIIHNAMRQFTPTVLYGSRGTGKTILARWLSFEILAYRLHEKGLSLKPSNITSPIGLWFRLDVDLLNVFNTRDPKLRDKFSRLFGQFFDLLILREALGALNTLGGIDAWCNDSELYKILAREMGRASPPKTYQDMVDCIEQCLADVRAFINNPERADMPYLIQDNVMLKLLVKELVKNGGFVNDCYFIAFIDEYELFQEYQQRIVNTRLKQVKESDRITYKLLARNGGIHTHETMAKNQPIEVTHDFRSYHLDEGVEFNDFKEHIWKIIGKRLNDSRYFTDRGYVTADSLFTNFSAEDEAVTLYKVKSNQPLIDWLKKHYKQMDIDTLTLWMGQEENILRQVVAVVLLNQGKSIDRIIEEFSKNSETSKDWYHNYSRGALYWMCSLYDKTKRYAGFDQIVGIAGNNTRVALDLCNAIVDAWLADDESKTLPITVAIQDAAIHDQSETYFRALRDHRNVDEDYRRFVERLGRLFELIHKGPRQGEPEINHFIIEGELDEKTEKALKYCRNEAILRWLPGNKQKGKADEQKDAWQLHPRYTPKFNISWRRKKMLKLRANELSVLFSGDENQWKQVVKRINDQYCKLSKLTSAASNQQSLFDENND